MLARCSEAVACAGACLPPCVNRAAACLATRTLDPPVAKIPREAGRPPHRSGVVAWSEMRPHQRPPTRPRRRVEKKRKASRPVSRVPPPPPAPPASSGPPNRAWLHRPNDMSRAAFAPGRRTGPGALSPPPARPGRGRPVTHACRGEFHLGCLPCRHGARGRRRCCCACAAPVRRSRYWLQ